MSPGNAVPLATLAFKLPDTVTLHSDNSPTPSNRFKGALNIGAQTEKMMRWECIDGGSYWVCCYGMMRRRVITWIPGFCGASLLVDFSNIKCLALPICFNSS